MYTFNTTNNVWKEVIYSNPPNDTNVPPQTRYVPLPLSCPLPPLPSPSPSLSSPSPPLAHLFSLSAGTLIYLAKLQKLILVGGYVITENATYYSLNDTYLFDLGTREKKRMREKERRTERRGEEEKRIYFFRYSLFLL